jgi:hypothetical protein
VACAIYHRSDLASGAWEVLTPAMTVIEAETRIELDIPTGSASHFYRIGSP